VQLEFCDVELKRDGSGGFVALCYNGEQLAYAAEFQHNRNFHDRFEMIDDLISTLEEALPKLLKPKGPPSFIESSFTTKVEYETWVKANFPSAA